MAGMAGLRGACLALLAALLPACGGGGTGGGPAPPGPAPFSPNFPPAHVELDAVIDDTVDPRIGCAGLKVYAVWQDLRTPGMREVYFNRSLDGGRTWLPTSLRLDSLPSNAQAKPPVVACSGDAVYVAWTDIQGGFSHVYLNRSLDAGQTWLPSQVRVNRTDSNCSQHQLWCDGSDLRVLWCDARNGAEDVYFNRSVDGGATWLPADVHVDSTTGAGTGNAYSPRIAAEGPVSYAAWIDTRNAGVWDIYFNRSVDGGATWDATDRRLDEDLPIAADSWGPRLCAEGGRVHVAWFDYRNSTTKGDIYYNGSPDGGITWRPSSLRLDTDPAGTGDSVWPSLACRGGAVWVAWEDRRAGAGVSRMNRSADGGATWLPADIRVSAGPTGTDGDQEQGVISSGAAVFAVWRDRRNGYHDVFMNFSLDQGGTWQAADVRVDSDVPAPGTSTRVDGCASDAGLFVLWREQRGASLWKVAFNSTLR